MILLKFQNNLYKELVYTDFKHYASIGIGLKIYSSKIELNWNRTLNANNTQYFKSHSYWTIGLSYDLISIATFK